MCMAFFVVVVLVRADRLVSDLYGLDQPSLPPPSPPQPLSRPWSVATPQTSLPSGNDALIRAGMVCVHGPFRAYCPSSRGPPCGRPLRSGPAVSAASASAAAAGSTVGCAPQTSLPYGGDASRPTSSQSASQPPALMLKTSVQSHVSLSQLLL